MAADKPWIASIKKKGQLAVFAKPSLKSAAWASVYPDAVKEFNTLSKKNRLGVVLTVSALPAASKGGADIEIDALNGKIAFSYGGAPVSELFDGSKKHGRTFGFSTTAGTEKAYVFLPLQPTLLPPSGGWRAAGPNILKAIAVHELIHACGLEDHSKDDLFYGMPTVDPGTTPAGDRLEITGRSPRVLIPPFVLSAGTVKRIRAIWV